MFTSMGVKSKRSGSLTRSRPDIEDRASWMQQPVRSDSSWVPVAPPHIETATSTTKFRIEPVNPSPRDTASKTRSSRNGSKEKHPVEIVRPEGISSRNRTVSTSSATTVNSEGGRSTQATSTSIKHSRHPLPQPRIPRGREETNEKEESRSGRGRSKSRSRQTIESTTRDRSSSKSRGRSKSKPREPSRDSRGASLERSTRITNAETKKRDRSRPPITRNGREGRSRDRSRSSNPEGRPRARSRSASLTRVTNPAHAPPSPSAKSAKSAKTTGRIHTERPPNPPSTIRTRGELRRTGEVTPRTTRSVSHADDGSLDARIGRDLTFGKQASSNASLTSLDRRKRAGLLGKLFGDQGNSSRSGLVMDQIRPRILLAATVYHNTATGLWITTINTNQRGVAKNPSLANKYLKAFSFPSEHEARESAIANAPPKMVSFHDSPQCYVCEGSFAVFRRASHCRNCGVCICKECSVLWPAKMLPDTYNLKNESSLKVCKKCNSLSKAFRMALIEGDYEEAIALYGTGNINLRTPFPTTTKKEEILYPIHCAVEGGNIEIVRWLVDGHFCPIKMVQSGGKKARRGAPESLIMTSRNRNVLSIAIHRLQVDMIRYLVVDCNVSIHESTDLESSLRALEAALIRLPRTVSEVPRVEVGAEPRWDNASFDEISEPSTLSGCERSQYEDAGTVGSKSHKTKGESCIICFDRKINCVCTPCGHQMCCLECSSNLKTCPVCNARGEFIKIFRP